MLFCRILSTLVASFSAVLLLTALTTDYWLVAYGVRDITHSGLWKQCKDGSCFAPATTSEYINVTRVFLILASLLALGSAFSLVFSFASSACGSMNRSLTLIPFVAAFSAGLFTLIAVAVYTAESWEKNTDPKIQVTYEWSFYLAWATCPMLLLAGILSLVVHLCSPRPGYEGV